MILGPNTDEVCRVISRIRLTVPRAAPAGGTGGGGPRFFGFTGAGGGAGAGGGRGRGSNQRAPEIEAVFGKPNNNDGTLNEVWE